MTTPTNQAVHVDAVLTNLSIAFLQNPSNFIASRVFPNVPVSKQSDRYFTYDRGDFNRDEARIRAPGAESAGTGFNLDNTPTYYTPVTAHHKDLAWQTMANADSVLDLTAAAQRFVMNKMMIRKEADFVEKYMTGGVWTNDVDGVSGTPSTGQVKQWSDYTDGDPIGDMEEAMNTILENTGYEPNTLLLGKRVFSALKDHPDIVDRVKYSGGVGNGNPARVNEQTLAALFGVERVLVSKAIANDAEKGEAEDSNFIAGKTAMLCFANSAPSLMDASAGYTFSWTGYLGQGNEFGVAMKRIPMDHLECDRIEGGMAFDHKVIAPDLGYFWDTIVA